MSIERIALVGVMPPPEDASLADPVEWPAFGVRRIHAEAASHPRGVEVCTFESCADRVDALIEDIVAFQPDLVGGSAYLWSFPSLVRIARSVRARVPDALIVIGGPSGRVEMTQFERYADLHRFVDALCLGEGEGVMHDVIDRVGCRDDLASIPGLAVATETGWQKTVRREPEQHLDRIASPYELNLMPSGEGVRAGYLETYRGCPMSCSFCQWGVEDGATRAFSAEYLTRELRAIERSNVRSVFHLDAGVNLNQRAFAAFAQASRETGFFERHHLFCQFYPSSIKDEHLEFLQDCKFVTTGLGLQLGDEGLLREHGRKTSMLRFARSVEQLASVSDVEVHLIVGLPGASPEHFFRDLDYVLTLPASVRVFHALALPDALLTRAPAEWALDIDADTLKIRSCLGWTREQMRQTVDRLDAIAAGRPGCARSELWWSFNNARVEMLSPLA